MFDITTVNANLVLEIKMESVVLVLKPIVTIALVALTYIFLRWIRLGYNKLKTPEYGREIEGQLLRVYIL